MWDMEHQTSDIRHPTVGQKIGQKWDKKKAKNIGQKVDKKKLVRKIEQNVREEIKQVGKNNP